MDLATIQIKVDTRQVKSAEDDLKHLGKTGSQAGKDVSKANKDMTESAGKATGAFKLMGAAMAAIGAGALVSKFAATVTESEKLKGALQTMTGSAENAGIAFQHLTQFAAETPFTLDQSVEGFIKLKALGLDPSERALRSYGNTSAAMGKDMMQMIEAVADASTGEFERLKEFGIKAKSEGDNVALTFRGVTTEIGKNSEEIQEYLLAIGETQFGDAMENQMARLPGLLSNLEDNVDALFRKIGDIGGIKLFGGAIAAASAAVVTMTDNIEMIITGIEVFGAALAAYFAPAIIGGIVTAVGAIRTGVLAMNAAILANPIGLVLAAIAAAAVLIIRHFDEIKLFAERAAVSIQIAWNKLKLFFMQGFAPVLTNIRDLFVGIKNQALATWSAVTAAVKDPLNAIETYNTTFDETLAALEDGESKADVFAESIASTETNIINLEREMDTLNSTVIDTESEVSGTTIALEDLGKEVVEEVAPALVDMKVKTEEVTEATKEGTVAFELQKNMLRNLQEDFGDMIYKTLSDGKIRFKDFFNSVVDGFKRMVAELAAQKIMDAIFGDGGLDGFLSKLSGGFSSVISSIASGIGGMVSSAASGIAGLVGGGGGAAAAQSAIAAGTSTMASSAAAAAGGTAAAGGAAGLGATLSAAGAKALAVATNPVTLTVAAAALAAKALDSGGTPTSAAGITMAKTAGMSDANVFAVPEFESGFAPLGFKQNATDQQAAAAVAPLRELDATLTALAEEAGYNVNLGGHTFSGLGVEGEGPGTFLGVSIEEGKQKGTSIEEQMDMYAKEWIYAVGARNGVPQSALDDVVGSGDAAGILQRSGDVLKGAIDGSHRDGLDMVPYDGYVAELHAGERVQTADQARASDSVADEMSGLRQSIEEVMVAVARNTQKLYRLNDRWDKNGLPPVRA
jgi:hypothetical protein